MLERSKSGYYGNKIQDEKLYKDITHDMSRFITRTTLFQLNHCYSTQRNETMNTSVAALVLKVGISTTISLMTQVEIAGACQILESARFWTLKCRELGFKIDGGLLSVLK